MDTDKGIKEWVEKEKTKYIVGVDMADGEDQTVFNIINKPQHKVDTGKPRLDLVPPEIIEAIGIVLTNADYEDNSWRGLEPKLYRGALMRHLVKYLKEYKGRDKKSGLYHLWHVAANVAILIVLEGLEAEE